MKTTIGLCYPVAGILNEETGDYSDGMVLGKAIKESFSVSNNDVKLYGDDAIVASDQSFKEGTSTLDTTGIEDEQVAKILGHEIDSTTGEVIAKSNDTAPYCGHGFYAKNYNNDYRAIFFPKVKFSEPNIENETKGDSTSYKSPSISYTVMENKDRIWKIEKTFKTESEAKAWLNEKVGISTIETIELKEDTI